MIDYVLDRAAELSPRTTLVVVGHQADELKAALENHTGLTFVVQEPQLGTAHALLTTEAAFTSTTGTLVLLSGDVPLLTANTLEKLVSTHREGRAAMTVITANVDRPHGYGRIVRSGQKIARIVEERDATSTERQIREINSGIYAFEIEGLFDAVRSIAAENAQGEYYLPDLVWIYRQRGLGVETFAVANSQEILGINSRAELTVVNHILRHEKNAALMAAGVTIEDPATTYVESDVEIGADTILHPGVSLERGTVVGAGCEIHSGARIVASRLGDRVTVLNHCVITDSEVESGASIGPFAHWSARGRRSATSSR